MFIFKEFFMIILRRKSTGFRRPLLKQKKKFSYIGITLPIPLIALVLYDGLINSFTYCGASVRFIRSLKTATLIAVDYWLINENDPNYEYNLKAIHLKSAKRILNACLLNGGLYIKVGQGFAAFNHILPHEYTRTLADLQNKCLETSKRDVQNVFLEDFGRKPEEIYKEFDYKAIAAASIAQVFKARLNDGQLVAVKVQYGDLRKRFLSDLSTIIFLQNIVEYIFKSYNFGWILKDIKANLEQELDFINEGKNAERCANDLKSLKFVYIPKVHWCYTKQRVLTVEWIDGYHIHDTLRIQASNMNMKDVDRKMLQMFAEQIFRSGFVHADPHSSNILVRRSLANGSAELVLIDHGLYEEMPKSIILSLTEFWEATILKDEKRMKRCALQMGVDDHIKLAEIIFQQLMHKTPNVIKTKLSAEDIQLMQQIAKENFDIIMATLKQMPRKLLLIIRNLNTIRAISSGHGDIVNRPKIMAQHAQHSLFYHCSSLYSYILWAYRRLSLEYSLWCYAVKRYCWQLYLTILWKLDRAPKSAKDLVKDFKI